MGATFFTREFTNAILDIAYELKKMNDLKETELILKYGLDEVEKAKKLREEF